MSRIKHLVKLIIMQVWAWIRPSRNSKILYYHDIFLKESYKSLDSDIRMGTSIEMFKKHLAVIKKEGYCIVSKITKDKGEVAIMLDDGFRGIWDNRQFFYDNQIKPTVFLAVELIGKEGFLKEQEILELQEHGFIFECHSWSHCRLDKMGEEELYRELKESKVYLENILKRPVEQMCLPIGYYSDLLLEQLNKYGYNEVYSSVSGDYKELVNGCMRNRNLCQFATPCEVKLILRGGGNALRPREEKMFYTKS